MYLERLLFLITGAFVFLCLGFALIIMASNPAKRPSDQIAPPSAEVADAQRPAAEQSGDRRLIPALQDAASRADDVREKMALLTAVNFLQLPSLSETLAER